MSHVSSVLVVWVNKSCHCVIVGYYNFHVHLLNHTNPQGLRTIVSSNHESGTENERHHCQSSCQQVCEVHQTDEQLLHPAPPILQRLRRGQLLHTAFEDFDVIFNHGSTLYLDSYRLVGDNAERFLTSAY